MSGSTTNPEVVLCNKTLNKIYTDLHVLISSFERGSSAELVNRLKGVEHGVEQLKESIRQIPDISGEEYRQKEKIKSLIKQEHASKNDQKIGCQICKSVIMLANVGAWEKERPFFLPLATQQKGVDTVQSEELEGWWAVKDMFDFENVGFTHSVDQIKYLTCADCEFGPIGFVDKETTLHYIAPSRVLPL